MEMTLETVESAVLRLPPSDRARLLDRLIASLDAQPEDMAAIDAAWDALADAREAALATGAAITLSKEELRAVLRQTP